MPPISPRRRARGGLISGLVAAGPDAVAPATREETLPVGMAAVVLSFVALAISSLHSYMLLYGDAVAHLGIARRIVDSRNPGLEQLGGVWLPLPHLLMLPFIGNMQWWQTGMAGAWPSMICYILSVMGVYRLSRRILPGRLSLLATAFYALNPNLLYLSTTAMTEPLFLALLVWITLLTMECLEAIRSGLKWGVSWRLVTLGALVLCAVMTRYDGWILGAVVWCVLAWSLLRAGGTQTGLGGVSRAFAIFTVLTVAGPLSWFWYNQHFFHDWLDFMRGPYSAVAIDRKTTPPGAHHYRGWHNMAWSLVLYLRTAQVDSTWWELGFLTLAAAAAGLVRSVRERVGAGVWLLWVPLPFYMYSIAYGSVPIFIPNFDPHSYYNSRYGMELLPAFAVFGVLGVEWMQKALRNPLLTRLTPPVGLALIVLNTLLMIHSVPLVLKEAMVNSVTRMAFERSLAEQMANFSPAVPILMTEADHIGALQQAGIPLRRTLNETDWDSWHAALEAPAEKAAYVISFKDDAVAKAVAAHPEGLTELSVLCTSGQTCARIYQSNVFGQR